ncbi:MAG: S8 family serine peptidase [Vicingus serpentipes]|nr:S8 family serine peptidase [Vicingus serpentipes]
MSIGENSPVHLPPFTTEVLYIKSGTNVDWSHDYYKIKDIHSKGRMGEGVKVAVLDTGVDLSHDSFKTAIAEGRLKAVDARSGYNSPSDLNGHGSWCVSRFISDGNQVLGFAPKVTLTSYKVLNDNGSGSLNNVLSGIDKAIEEGHHIISTSLGWSGNISSFNRMVEKVKSKNIIWVSAAGNDGTSEDIDYPALYEYVMSIGSHDKNGNRSAFSDYGKELDYYSSGQEVLGAYTKNREAYLQGTSMATPSFGALLSLIYFDVLNKYGAVNRGTINKLVRCR